MKKIRNNVFETNSSSTHALAYVEKNDNYVSNIDQIKIRFIDTDEDRVYSTLKDKVSYLVGHIINYYKYDCVDYDDLIEHTKRHSDFKVIEEFILKKYNKKIVFPINYKYNIEDIVTINHQLLTDTLNDLLYDILYPKLSSNSDDQVNALELYFDEHYIVELGRD